MPKITTKKETIKSTNTKEKKTDKSENNLEQENKQLRLELDEIKKLLANLTQNQVQTTPPTSPKQTIQEELTEVDIRQNKYIKVMSLNFGMLVLSTEGRGQGKVFEFPKFGDVKNIVYADLANIIHHQQKFAEQGRFYIFDKNVVKNHGLIEYYDKFLTKEVIEKILEYNRDQITDLFNSTTDAQRETITGILIKKIKNNEYVDLNKVDIISRLYGQNIYEIANEYKEEQE
jgi:hypothetical protein